MRLTRTFDREYVKEVITHPAVYSRSSDDGSPVPSEYEPPEMDAVYFLKVWDGEPLGLYMLVPSSSASLEIHTCLLPIAMGKRALKASRMLLEWAFSHTASECLFTRVPEFNKPALAYAKRAGLSVIGELPMSFMRHGVLQGQTILCITKEAWKCQQQSQ